MLKLGGKVLEIKNVSATTNQILSVTTNEALPAVLKKSKAYLVESNNVTEGFLHYILLESQSNLVSSLPEGASYSILPNEYSYIGNGDIIRLSPDRNMIRVLFRASSPYNSILVTEQCNHYCLMCSQPPKNVDDSWLLDEIEQLIPLIPKNATELGFSGGEPTLCGERFLKILNLVNSYLPRTAIHILSNGRRFKNTAFAQRYADINHHDIMVGIPLYSDDPVLHDYIVQSKGAFDETVQGILNLKRLKQQVEVRIVIHKPSIKRLKQLCEFLVRNLLFVDHVALMGLEMTGFTRANLELLWIDPYDYKNTLSEAVNILDKYGMNVSIYNHPLCLVTPAIYPFYRKSISDWKNEYASECRDCTKKSDCGGFFSSGIKYGYSNHLRPFD